MSLTGPDDNSPTGNRLAQSASSISEIEEVEEAADDSRSPVDQTLRPTFGERFRQIGTAMSMLRTFTTSTADERPARMGASSADKAEFRLGIGRSMRAYHLFEEIRVDYQRSLAGLAPESKDWESTMLALHRRSAKKCLELARANGGLYIKVPVLAAAAPPAFLRR